MLSTENPPPDSSETSQLKSGSSSSNNSSCSNVCRDDDDRASQLQVVDLSKDDNTPLPKFSIRDYVFNARRGNDIVNHWPFSPKNLQLCLKHGVKDVLPPFDSVGEPSTVEDTNNSDVKLSESGDHRLCVSSNKVESDSQTSVKKCRLVEKLSEPKLNGELPVNASVVPDPIMASKVCPVCKTYTSSSNTTLNAHIDQCLSGESTVKWAADTKAVKHKMKPRKTKPMVDIYATAAECTLEDLDRRNGTNWALNLDIPVEDMEVCDDEKNPASSSVNCKDKNDVGAVYFDSNGTKLRILSEFSDRQSNSNLKGDDFGPHRLVRTAGDSKCIKKKRHLVHRHELQKRPSREQSCSPTLDNCPEAARSRERDFPPEEDEEEQAQPLSARDQMKFDDFGKIKQWVGSKRTGLKKINPESENQRHPDKIVKDLRPNRHQLPVSDKVIKRKCGLTFGKKKILAFTSEDEYVEQSCLRKRDGFPFEDCRGEKNCLMFSKCDVLSRKDGPSVRKRRMTDSSVGTESHGTSLNSKKLRRASPARSLIGSRISLHDTVSSQGEKIGSIKKPLSDRAILLGGKKLTSLRKNASAAKRALNLKKLGKKNVDYKKRRMHWVCTSDDEAGENACQMEKPSHKSSMDRAVILRNRKERWESMTTGKGADAETPPARESDGMKKIGSFVAGDASNVLDPVEEVEIRDEFICEPTSKLSGGEACKTFGDSLDSESPPEAKMNSQDYVRAYQERCPPDLVSVGDQENYCADKAVAEGEASEARGNYFVDVDPIPIPGPPGCFLPSPGRMGSEELQGNSSLTTCRIPSSEDEHELVDMETSASPVSATSFASARSDSMSFANLAARSQGVQHDSQCNVSEERTIDPAVESSVPIEQAVSIYEKAKPDESRMDMVMPEMSSGTFKNGLPCRCSRKEGAIQSGSFNYHDWELERGRTMAFLPPAPSFDKQTDRDQTEKCHASNSRSETLSEKELTPELEKAAAKFPTYGDCESPSPSSTSNSVLRLMGKNLMVVKKEDNQSPPIGPTQSNTFDNYPGLQYGPFHNALSQSPVFGDLLACAVAPQFLDFKLWARSTSCDKFKMPEMYPYHPSRSMVSSKSFGEGLTPSLQRHQHPDRRNLRTTDSSKEIIIIDDSPDYNDGGLSIKPTGRSSVHGATTRAALPYDSRHANHPFYNYQTPRFPLHSRSQMVHTANAHQVQMNESWNRNLGGSTAIHCPGHQRSPSVYVSPSFSLPKSFT